MRRILRENVVAGMRLAKPLYGANNQIILNQGAEIKEGHIGRILNAEVSFLYVEDDDTSLIGEDDQEAQKNRHEIVTEAHGILDEMQVGKYVDVSDTRRQVIELLDECCLRRDLQPLFVAMRDFNDYLFKHAVTGYFFAMRTGISMGLDGSRLRELGLGALIRDAGMLQVPPDIVNKTGGLSPEEMEEVKSHTEKGFESIRLNPDISLVSANCALQHHERYNGSGYPRGLDNSKIHEFAQIVGISDVYASMTVNTAYRKAMPVYYTTAVINKASGQYFCPDLLRSFTAGVVKFPTGSVVQLSNKCTGTVEGHADELGISPQIRLVLDGDGRRMNNMVTVDLGKDPNLFIVDVQ
ncbi:MAG TPA: HD domain-containing phosphohydrolase [Patescibacteria group bacterium]|nr:HD domain-containing phosphohydrolase [Patescibacteria group bacterium]